MIYGPAGTALSVIWSSEDRDKRHRFRRELVGFCGAIYPTAIMTCVVGPVVQQLGQHSHDEWLLFSANRRLRYHSPGKKAIAITFWELCILTRTLGKPSVSSVAA